MKLPAPQGGLPSAELQQKSFDHNYKTVTITFQTFKHKAQYNTAQYNTREGLRAQLTVVNTAEQRADL